MVNYVVPDGEVLAKATALAEKLAGVSKTAMAQTKRLFHEVVDLSLEEGLARGRDLNRKMRGLSEK